MRVVSPAPRDAWRALVAASGEAVVYQTPEWVDACCLAGGYHDRSRLYEMPDGRCLLLPLTVQQQLAQGDAVGTSSEMGTGGLLAPDRLTTQDVATVIDDIRRRRVRTIIKPGIVAPEAWSGAAADVRRSHTVHVVDLRCGFEDLWLKRLSANTRSKIRRAERAGVTVDWDSTAENVPIAWGLYVRWATPSPCRMTGSRAAPVDGRRDVEPDPRGSPGTGRAVSTWTWPIIRSQSWR